MDFWNLFGISWGDTINLTKVNAHRDVYRRHAIGYTESSELAYRPRENSKAVLFQTKGQEFWFHLDNAEFEAVFGIEA